MYIVRVGWEVLPGIFLCTNWYFSDRFVARPFIGSAHLEALDFCFSETLGFISCDDFRQTSAQQAQTDETPRQVSPGRSGAFTKHH